MNVINNAKFTLSFDENDRVIVRIIDTNQEYVGVDCEDVLKQMHVYGVDQEIWHLIDGEMEMAGLI